MMNEHAGIENPQLPGARLHAQRERRGLTLAQAASELHVAERLLRALEEDDYVTLGAPIFVKGHLRNYARLLGLDATEIVAHYEAAQQPADPELVAHRPDGPRMDQHRPQAWVGWFGWVFLLLLGLLLAGWWYYQQEGGAGFELTVPGRVVPPPQLEESEPGANAQTGLQTEIQQGATSRTPPDAGAPEMADAGEPDVAADATGTTQPAPEENQESLQTTSSSPIDNAPAAEPATPPAAPVTRPDSAGESGLVLAFNQESWVEVYDAEGRPILYDLVGAGARRTINASGQLRVFLGNSDGVEVFVGGERFAHERHRRQDSTARFTVTVPSGD